LDPVFTFSLPGGAVLIPVPCQLRHCLVVERNVFGALSFHESVSVHHAAAAVSQHQQFPLSFVYDTALRSVHSLPSHG